LEETVRTSAVDVILAFVFVSCRDQRNGSAHHEHETHIVVHHTRVRCVQRGGRVIGYGLRRKVFAREVEEFVRSVRENTSERERHRASRVHLNNRVEVVRLQPVDQIVKRRYIRLQTLSNPRGAHRHTGR